MEMSQVEDLMAKVDDAFSMPGRMLSGSKSAYLKSHPKNVVFFNANMYDAYGRKLWHGDLDLTKDKKKLMELAQQIGGLYVAKEMPYRFEIPTLETLKKATLDTLKMGINFGEVYYFGVDNK